MKQIKQVAAILLLIVVAGGPLSAKQYYGSFFGMESDGVTNNTGSMQKAIDFISEKGQNDTLTLWVGRYIIGSIELKSNVTIQLREGAILVGIESAHDYRGALLWANGKENITIFGKGVIEGSGCVVRSKVEEQQNKGFVEHVESTFPSLVAMNQCKNIRIQGITLQDAATESQRYENCSDVNMERISVFNTKIKGNRGIVIEKGNRITISNSFFNTSGTPIEAVSSSGVKAIDCLVPSGSRVVIKQ